jgi:lysophospholipase L1-like esterase
VFIRITNIQGILFYAIGFSMKIFVSAICLFLLLSASPSSACPTIDGLVDVNCDGQLVIAGFGDSITFGRSDTPEEIGYPGRLKYYFPSVTAINLGVPGENTYIGRSRAVLQFSEFDNIDYAIVLMGVNDYFVPERTSIETRDNILAIANSARTNGAISIIANLTEIQRFDQRPWVLSVNNRIAPFKLIDFFSLGTEILSYDLIHPDQEGYDIMAELVVSVVQSVSAANVPADSDSDGIYDFAESKFGSSAFDSDSDDDGLLDGAEVFTHGSSPVLVDTDSDGLTDPQEVSIGSNPASAAPSAPVMKSFEIL